MGDTTFSCPRDFTTQVNKKIQLKKCTISLFTVDRFRNEQDKQQSNEEKEEVKAEQFEAFKQTMKEENVYEETTEKPDLETVILEKSLIHVFEKGFSTDALSAAAREVCFSMFQLLNLQLGLSDQAHGIFPSGAFAIVEYIMQKALKDVTEKIQQIPNLEK